MSVTYGLVTNEHLTAVADAIRAKGDTSSPLSFPTEFVSAIEAISGGVDISDTTATAGDVLDGKYFYTADGTKTEGTILTVNPAFDGGTLSGSSTAVGTNVTLSTSTNSGLEIQTKYSASRSDVLYNGAVSGLVNKADNDLALASASLSATNGTKYYITGVTVQHGKTLTVDTESTASVDVNINNVVVYNESNRKTKIYNRNNGITYIVDKGRTYYNTSDGGNLYVAFGSSSSTYTNIINNGSWKVVSPTQQGTYFGCVEVYDSNLIADNIKSGVTIFGITGSYSGTDVSDTTATASDVANGKYFYNSSGIKTQGMVTFANGVNF